MVLIQKILVPVDFSACSGEALRFACDLAKRYGAPMTLLHVYQSPVYFYPFPAGPVLPDPMVEASQRARITEALLALKEEAEAQGALAVSTAISDGSPFQEIIQKAQKEHYDLIVMGTHGRTGIKHALLGSVTERVVRMAPCPVLTVRHSEAPLEA